MAPTHEDTTPLLEALPEDPLSGIDVNIQQGPGVQRAVPPEKWCVTILDVDSFAERVRDMQRSGSIPDTEDPEGPSMDLVCEHLVIPETRRAGGTSWALMLHPEGLPVGAYISHSFAEGVYEFQRKVRGSMPQGQSRIWSRLFALPQARGGEYLLSLLGEEPLVSSPHAVAIAHADLVLVVPNRIESVFLRSWCVFEACVVFRKDLQLMPAVDMFQCSKRTSIGSTSHAAAKIQDSLPQAIDQLFNGFESVRLARCDDAAEARIRGAIAGAEDWLDSQIRAALMEFL